MSDRIFNFSAGPAVLPLAVLEKAQGEVVDFRGAGMSIMEMSHRSKEADGVIKGAEQSIRDVLGVPEDYAVLFLQGGASLQFAMAPMNLYIEGKPIDVLHTGSWTKKAITEMEKTATYRLAGSTAEEKFRRLPRADEIKFSPDASYVHLCSNNTIAGTQWKAFPDAGEVPLAADMSSDIMSRRVDVSRFGLIYAGAQKNLGPAGVTLVIIRRDLADRAPEDLPAMLQYRTHIKGSSLYNTPPVFAIYMMGLVMEWVQNEGGLPAMEKRNQEKAQVLYDAIDASGFFYCPVEKADRSLMNVVFRITGDKEDLEKQFAAEATQAGLSGLKGHRSVGGLRASIYNAHPVEGVRALVEFMKRFEKKNG